jgi:hypothetical protein
MVGAGIDGRRARVAGQRHGRLAGDAGEDRRRGKGLDGRADVWLAAGGAGVWPETRTAGGAGILPRPPPTDSASPRKGHRRWRRSTEAPARGRRNRDGEPARGGSEPIAAGWELAAEALERLAAAIAIVPARLAAAVSEGLGLIEPWRPPQTTTAGRGHRGL